MTISALFACCSSQDRRASKLETETRHARIISVTSDRPRSQRYSDNPPRYDDVAQQPLITLDEKDAARFDFHIQPDDEAGNDAPAPLSAASSVISIPSTRYTDLTSMNTGETARSFARMSLETSSTGRTRPPSYHARAMETPSPSATEDSGRDGILQHPVMRRDWLQVLRQEALRDAR